MNINEHNVQPAVTFASQQSINVITLTYQCEKKLVLMHTCVCADVSSEQPRSGEGLAAGWTYTG